MFELTGKDIEKLNDTDLRSLVGMLCEAELRLNKLPVSGVTWGGHQDAKDGGIDVQVKLKEFREPLDFIPRAMTGFQTKKPAMGASEIKKEMRPKGVLRESIKELAKEKGAYIIVSSKSSVSKSALDKRVVSMKNALNDLDEKNNLYTDFFGQNRIATWVRCYPSIVLWVRERIGKPMSGWQQFRDWSKHDDNAEGEYFMDDNIRIHEEGRDSVEGDSAIVGIKKLRKRISDSSSSVRLVGLSGVGKTRLLQALFDSRIGESPLNRDQVVYTDMGQSPNPVPVVFARKLIASNQDVILAIDNCPPDLHLELVKICCYPGSKVKLITIEYDIKDDQIEQTDFFRLEPASISLIEKIIRDQFQFVGADNARTIADSSGGNARIAFAIARTLRKGDAKTYLKEKELFKRLFFQRNEVDKSLLSTGEICSLFYSFNFEPDEEDFDEMNILALLAEKTKTQLYADIAELQRRELVQQRGKWRAILPHAIANRLASQALENIPFNVLANTIERSSERLIKSFAHRLNFLNDNKNAEKILSRWFSENGFLGDLHNLSNNAWDVFKYVALVSPVLTLNAIEHAINFDLNNNFPVKHRVKEYSTIVSAIAYDGRHFERALHVIKSFYLSSSSKEDKENWLQPLIETLFYIKYSRSNTNLKDRISVVEKFFNSSNQGEQYLGLLMLKGLLEASNLRPFYGYSNLEKRFSDYGYYPKSNKEIGDWFATVIQFCSLHVLKPNYIGENVKIVLAKSLRGLLNNPKFGINNELENIATKISDNKMWVEGWMAIRQTIMLKKKKLDREQLNWLVKLEKKLAPVDLIDRVRTYVLSEENEYYALLDPLGDRTETQWDEAMEMIQSLGGGLVKDQDSFKVLLPQMITANFSYGRRIQSFCKGLAESCEDPIIIWSYLKDEYVAASGRKNFKILHDYIKAVSEIDLKLTDKILEYAFSDDLMIQDFPRLQSAIVNDPQRWKRMRFCLEKKTIPIDNYLNLGWMNLQEDFNKYITVLELLLLKEGGVMMTIKILYMSVFSTSAIAKYKSNAQIRAFGRKLLTLITFDRTKINSENIDYKLKSIIEGCFENNSSVEGVQLCENIIQAYSNYKITLSQLSLTLVSLAKKQPICFLNHFVNTELNLIGCRQGGEIGDSNPVSQINVETLICWCEGMPNIRYKKLASFIVLFKRNKETNKLEFSDIANELLEKAPSVSEILEGFKQVFYPSIYKNSEIPYHQERLDFLDSINREGQEDLGQWIAEMKLSVKERIDRYLRMESFQDGSRFESFE